MTKPITKASRTPFSDKKVPKIHRVFGWDPTEVSFVRKPGNWRKMLTHRSEESMTQAPSASQQVIDRLKTLDPGIERHIQLNVGKRKIERDAEGTQLDPLDAQTLAALKASARVLAGFSDTLRMSDIMAMAQQIGVTKDDAGQEQEEDEASGEGEGNGEVAPPPKPPEGEAATAPAGAKEGSTADVTQNQGGAAKAAGAPARTMVTNMQTKPQGVSDADHKAAQDAAQAAYSKALEAKGHKIERSAEPPAAVVSEAAPPADKKGEGEGDGEDDSAVATDAFTPEQMSAVEAMIAKHTKHLTQRSADQEAELKAEREARLKRDCDARAEKYKALGVPTDKVSALLRSASGNPEVLEAMESAFATACERTKASDSRNGNLFGERGTRQGNVAAGSAEAKLEGLANSLIQRSAEAGQNKTFPDAYREALYSPQGREIWASMNAGQGA